jgi:hypothetical protein
VGLAGRSVATWLWRSSLSRSLSLSLSVSRPSSLSLSAVSFRRSTAHAGNVGCRAPAWAGNASCLATSLEDWLVLVIPGLSMGWKGLMPSYDASELAYVGYSGLQRLLVMPDA